MQTILVIAAIALALLYLVKKVVKQLSKKSSDHKNCDKCG